MEKQTAGRTRLGDLAPQFAALNDDVLFGQVWSRTDQLGLRDRALVTVVALVSSGVVDASLRYHLENARNQGLTKGEVVEVVTQLAFYVGWPRAWAVFPLVREVWADEPRKASNPLFGLGDPNTAYANFFTGASYLKVLTPGFPVYNVTFEPGCRNHWHLHGGGGQILLCTDGQGWYQERGQPARRLGPGDVVVIPPGVEHWHGATAQGWFTHLALEVPGPDGRTEWREPVDDDHYQAVDGAGEPR